MTAQTRFSPATVEEAADFLGEAATESRTVGFTGSGSRRALGGSRGFDWTVDSTAMGSVVDWLVEDLTVVVGAGMTVGDLEAMLATENQTSLLPVTEPGRTIGGLVAEGASGPKRLKYGPTRDRVLEVTIATGYGKVVRGGGRLVKNVTGYDLPRLITGSLGSLGFIGTVCLKLWPLPPVQRIVAIDDPAAVHQKLFRPVAVVETEDGAFAMLEGSESDVDAQVEAVGGSGDTVAPRAIDSPVFVSLRVPPRHLSLFVEAIRSLLPERFVAQHGVGVVDIGLDSLDDTTFLTLRSDAENVGGSLVVIRPGDSLNDVDPWGTPPSTLGIQQRMKDLFDPSRVCNPGVLPGGL